LSRPDKKI